MSTSISCSRVARHAIPHAVQRTAFAALPILAACAGAPATVPAELQPSPGQRELETLAARGVQIYECRPGAAAQVPRWTLVAPDAQLFDTAGRVVGSHGAGPHWMAADGSAVVGTVSARKDAPIADAVPWLLLQTRNSGGPGRFAVVTAIQRLNTAGGLAPESGCVPGVIGTQVRVPYSADYRFFVSSGG